MSAHTAIRDACSALDGDDTDASQGARVSDRGEAVLLALRVAPSSYVVRLNSLPGWTHAFNASCLGDREWSYAAQGTDGRVYPWGDVPGCKAGDMACLEKSAIDGSHCPLLQQHTQGDQEGLANVTAYPQGASPFGVMDLVGNVSGAVVVYRSQAHARGSVLSAVNLVRRCGNSLTSSRMSTRVRR